MIVIDGFPVDTKTSVGSNKEREARFRQNPMLLVLWNLFLENRWSWALNG